MPGGVENPAHEALVPPFGCSPLDTYPALVSQRCSATAWRPAAEPAVTPLFSAGQAGCQVGCTLCLNGTVLRVRMFVPSVLAAMIAVCVPSEVSAGASNAIWVPVGRRTGVLGAAHADREVEARDRVEHHQVDAGVSGDGYLGAVRRPCEAP